MPNLEDMLVKGVLTIVAVMAAGETVGWVLNHYGNALAVVGLIVIVGRLVWWWTDRRWY